MGRALGNPVISSGRPECHRKERNEMSDILTEMNRKHAFLVCVDSDGCVFDNMELKHKECFCPATVNVWNLQNVSRYARESAEFVNLYSKTRGFNRYPALVRTLELLGERKEAKERGYICPDLTPLKTWIRGASTLSLAALKAYVAALADPDPILLQTIQWSEEVDHNIAHIVRGVNPLPGVKEALALFQTFADIVIVSATPHEAIVREWKENGLLSYVTEVAGQELGTKEDCIRKAVNGCYDPGHVLMIGDAPGDQAAAQANGVLFYPIIPGKETQSWKLAAEHVAEELQKGTYQGEPMAKAIRDFHEVLLENPRWQE